MAVRVIADAVKLQIRIAQASLERLSAEFLVLGEFNAIRCSLYAVVSKFLGISDGVNKVRAQRRFPARELDRHLAPWLDLQRGVENLLAVVPRQSVGGLPPRGVHEDRIAPA